jgi:hypothetical protein
MWMVPSVHAYGPNKTALYYLIIISFDAYTFP